jgi:phosphoglycolate phosphatase
MNRDYQGVFFDLDGTLADTAPDLVAAINAVRSERGLAALPYEQLRPLASAGARGLIGGAFNYGPDHPEFEELRSQFLGFYEQALCVNTRLFEGMPEVLEALETQELAWGIVTNKAARLTDPLVQALGLSERSAATVSGDTTPHAKPHPAPILQAAQWAKVSAQHCIYVGDDLRDIQAGQAAGMITVAAAYGYCGCEEPIDTWGADHIIHSPLELLKLL